MEQAPGLVGDHYRSVRLRFETLLAPLDTEQWERPVAACPGWRVRDVLAHLVGIIEDAAAGELSGGPPSTEQTTAEVDRHRDDDPPVLLQTWTEAAPLLEAVVSEQEMWPAFIDVLSHEHDVRTALDQPGGRDHPDVELAASLLTTSVDAPVSVEFDLGDRVLRSAGDEPPAARLSTSAFEVLRLRLGRRSRAQVAALDWSGDRDLVLDHLFIFGPTATPLIE
ncbi:MAG: maleylpyruvate isomerase family mycothiol-dependent enzyme [Acidimicrobiales bacterium]